MNLISASEALADFRKEIKQEHGKVFTNFWLSPEEISHAIASQNLFTERVGNSIFIFYNNPRFYRLFYFTPNREQLLESLKSLEPFEDKNILFEEISGSLDDVFGALNLSSFKFESYMVLNMMSLGSAPECEAHINPSVATLNTSQINDAEAILCTAFDPVLERVPEGSVLRRWAEDGGGYAYIAEGKIAGLIFFTIANSTIHLEYWWVAPEARGKGVGSSLMNVFFKAAKEYDCKNLILWVDVNNQTAIRNYEHYGFKPLKRFDHIYKF